MVEKQWCTKYLIRIEAENVNKNGKIVNFKETFPFNNIWLSKGNLEQQSQIKCTSNIILK